MGCRCHSISNCQHDIKILDKSQEYVKELIEVDSNVEDKLNTLAGLYTTTFTVTNIGQLTTRNNTLNDRLNELFQQIDKKISDEIVHLKEELVYMEDEDREYHDREREHHHHHHDD